MKWLLPRLAGLLFFSVFSTIAVSALIFLSSELYSSVKPVLWDKIPCTIKESNISQEKKGNRKYIFQTAYEYNYKGRIYTSFMYSITYKGDDKLFEANRKSTKYHVGKKATCYVDPSDPAAAVLDYDSPFTLLFLLIPAILSTVGLGGLYFTIRPKKLKSEIKPLTKKNDKIGIIFILLFFGIFFIAGMTAAYFTFFKPVYNLISASSWEPVQAKVISSRVKSHSDSDGTTYSIEILYEYKINGQTYRNDSYNFMNFSSSGYKSKRQITRQYPKGKKITIYFDPDNPHSSVINRNFTAGYLLGLLSFIFVGVGATGLYFGLFRRKHKSGKQKVTEDKALPDAYESLRIPPAKKDINKFIGSLIFSLIWLPVSGWVLYLGVFEEKSILLTIFAGIFTIIGIIIFSVAVKFGLRAMNEKPVLQMSPLPSYPGAQMSLSWTMKRPRKLPDNMNITLACKEWVQYTRGTNTVTKEEKFFEELVFDTDDRFQMANGSITFNIPENAMHSFSARHNRIEWVIIVNISLPGWPDILDEYNFTVLPDKDTKI